MQRGEHGYAGTTVAEVCSIARVSRSTFYEIFDSLQDCFIAVMDDGCERVNQLIFAAFEREEYWLNGVRGALLSVLGFLDEQPSLARVWMVETLAAGSWALEYHERYLGTLLREIVERWQAPPGVELNPLAAAAVLELVVGIVRSRLVSGSEEPFVELLGPLMGLIATVYLGTAADSARDK